jgi:hypothetical protein
VSQLSVPHPTRRGRPPKKQPLAGTAPVSPPQPKPPKPPRDYSSQPPSYSVGTSRTDAIDDPRPSRRAVRVGKARGPPADPNALLDVKQLSAWWAISVSALNKARITGDGPKFVRLLGGVVRYRVRDCLDYIEARAVQSTSDLIPE